MSLQERMLTNEEFKDEVAQARGTDDCFFHLRESGWLEFIRYSKVPEGEHPSVGVLCVHDGDRHIDRPLASIRYLRSPHFAPAVNWHFIASPEGKDLSNLLVVHGPGPEQVFELELPEAADAETLRGITHNALHFGRYMTTEDGNHVLDRVYVKHSERYDFDGYRELKLVTPETANKVIKPLRMCDVAVIEGKHNSHKPLKALEVYSEWTKS